MTRPLPPMTRTRESMKRPYAIDAKVLQSTYRPSRCLLVLVHTLGVNIDCTPPLMRKGVRTYRRRSTFRKTRRLATARAGVAQIPRDFASAPGGQLARPPAADLRGRGGRRERRCARQFSRLDSAVACIGGRHT